MNNRYSRALPRLGRVLITENGEVFINGEPVDAMEFLDLAAGVCRASAVVRGNRRRPQAPKSTTAAPVGTDTTL